MQYHKEDIVDFGVEINFNVHFQVTNGFQQGNKNYQQSKTDFFSRPPVTGAVCIGKSGDSPDVVIV